MRFFKQIVPLLVAVVALQLLFRFGLGPLWSGVGDRFWLLSNQIDVLQQVSVNAILAFGITLTILIGGIDLSVGAMVALVGTATVDILGATELGHSERMMIGVVCGAGALILFEAFYRFGLPESQSSLGPQSLGRTTAPWLARALLFLAAAGGVFYFASGTVGLSRLFLGLWVGLSVAACFGIFNGVCAAKTRMPAFIITLATMEIARGGALRFNHGEPVSVPRDQTWFLGLGNGRLFGTIPIPVIVMGVVFVLVAVLLHRTRFGQHLYAMGGNREAARYTGIRLARNEIAVYTLCSLLAGLAGMIHASQLYSAEPASGAGFELDAIAAAVVGGASFTGGIGTMGGTLIGAVIIGILNKGLNQAGVHFSYQHMIKGLVILVAVYFDVRRRK